MLDNPGAVPGAEAGGGSVPPSPIPLGEHFCCQGTTCNMLKISGNRFFTLLFNNGQPGSGSRSGSGRKKCSPSPIPLGEHSLHQGTTYSMVKLNKNQIFTL
jgi:hypothetical protein